MHSTFLFDNMHDDYVRESVLSHPYLSRFPRSIESNVSHENSIDSIFNSTKLSRKRRTLAYDTDTKTLGIDVCIENDYKVIKNLPFLDLEFNFKIPVTQVFEDTFFNIEIPHNMNMDLFVLTDEPCADKQWKTTIEPVLSQIEELISMLGVDGRGCVMRSVCELAASPISRPEGIVGELLQVFFDYISNMEFARSEDIEDIENNETEESEKDEDQDSTVEKDDNQYSKDEKKKTKQSLLKKINKLENMKKSDTELEKESEVNQEESSFSEDPLLKSEEPLSMFDDLLQDLESQIKLKRHKRDYLAAAVRGRSNADCREHYSTCPISLFQLASQEDY